MSGSPLSLLPLVLCPHVASLTNLSKPAPSFGSVHLNVRLLGVTSWLALSCLSGLAQVFTSEASCTKYLLFFHIGSPVVTQTTQSFCQTPQI